MQGKRKNWIINSRNSCRHGREERKKEEENGYIGDRDRERTQY